MLLGDTDGRSNFEIQDPVEVTEEALSQLELEAIIPNDMQADQKNEGRSVIYEGTGTSTST
jgi:hypothetical protein